jgi:hypothetical protein
MAWRKHKPEQIVTLLRQIEVGIANGKTTPQACKEAEIPVQSYYRWRKEYGGLKLRPSHPLSLRSRQLPSTRIAPRRYNSLSFVAQ